MSLIFGEHDDATKQQLEQCVTAADGAVGVLCADGHLGYSMPIGGVVGYPKHVSPSGVGFDIACGNLAVKTDVKYADVVQDADRIANEIQSRISFGVGRKNNEPVDDAVLERIAKADVPGQRGLASLAASQLGTVGSGNHYVDVLEDTDGYLWIACHFGSRGFGHKTATMFMNIAQGLAPDAKNHDGGMMAPPLLLDMDLTSGQDYLAAAHLAGEYAYAGRRHVVQKVLDILGNPQSLDVIHNHHNFAWVEFHNGMEYFVHRKGATPAFPRQRGFIGGNMNDICVIVEGQDSELSQDSLYSTVHGAGRVMSRTAAIKGKHQWSCGAGCTFTSQQVPKTMRCLVHDGVLGKEFVTPPVDFKAVQKTVRDAGVILRGAGADESPQCYRSLPSVLAAHEGTIKITTLMRPRIVVMAGKDVRDPYKD